MVTLAQDVYQPVQRTQHERRQTTRQKIIVAATSTLGEQGFERASLDDISAAAGVSKGAVYNYFVSKDALIRAVLSNIVQLEEGALVSVIESHSDNRQALLTALVDLLLHGNPIHTRLWQEYLIYASHNNDIKQIVQETTIRRRDRIGYALGCIAGGGDHRTSWDEMAEMLLAITDRIKMLESLGMPLNQQAQGQLLMGLLRAISPPKS